MDRSNPLETADHDSLVQLRRMVEKARTAMLTTLTGDGHLRSRPIHTQQIDEHGMLWFFVSTAQPKVGEIVSHEGRVCVSYCDTVNQNFVSLSGVAHLVHDAVLKDSMWNSNAELWFPGGLKDPAVSLLKVEPDYGEMWDAPASTTRRLLAYFKVATTGDSGAFGTHQKFRIT